MQARVALIPIACLVAGCTEPVGPGESVEGVATNGAVELQYVVDFPDGVGPFPTVVYGPGSGDVTVQNESVVEHARELVRMGFAVVRYDKRGVGRSTGERLDLSTANSESVVPALAADMLAVLREARSLPRVDGSRVALFGASQANWYLPLVARDASPVEWMILLTGGLLPVGPKVEWERLVFVEGRDPFAAATMDEWRQYAGPVGFDQRPILQDLDIPMLYLLGDRDRGVPIDPMLGEASALAADGVNITVEAFPGGEHLLPETDFWSTVADWLAQLED